MGHPLLLTLFAIGVFTATIRTAECLPNIKKILDVIPSSNDILEWGKETIIGLPQKVVLDALHELCLVILSADLVMPLFTPDVNLMRLILITGSENITVPLLEPERLWTKSLFDHKLDTVLLITGWLTDINNAGFPTIDLIYSAFRARGNYNFVVFDPACSIKTLYSWSSFNSEEIGKLIGTSLTKFTNDYPHEKIHVIAHSLGAQIASMAGRHYYAQTKKLLSHITGLDPANPCFEEGHTLNGLSRGDAEFVDIFHTNNGALGQENPTGDVDFYPNGIVVLQPGCLNSVCAHARSVEFYAETVYPGNENNFMAARCSSQSELEAGNCSGDPVPMGYSVPNEARGTYFAKTRSSSPFGGNST